MPHFKVSLTLQNFSSVIDDDDAEYFVQCLYAVLARLGKIHQAGVAPLGDQGWPNSGHHP